VKWTSQILQYHAIASARGSQLFQGVNARYDGKSYDMIVQGAALTFRALGGCTDFQRILSPFEHAF
jgi:hypothetical protein